MPKRRSIASTPAPPLAAPHPNVGADFSCSPTMTSAACDGGDDRPPTLAVVQPKAGSVTDNAPCRWSGEVGADDQNWTVRIPIEKCLSRVGA